MDVIPSFYDTRSLNDTDKDSFLTDRTIRVGEVQNIIYPEDKDNVSGLYIEYHVYAPIKQNGIKTNRLYRNCVLVNLLGSFADSLTWTLRHDNKPAQNFNDNNRKTFIGKGSKVLIACADGERSNAVIIGGTRDPSIEKDNDKGKKDLGHHLNFVFNGVNINVNKDGELLIKYNGKTDLDGKSEADESVQGTSIQILKNGNTKIFTKDNEQLIELDHEKKNINITAKNNLNIKSDKGTLIDDATDNMIKGSTYRRKEQQLHNQLKSYLQTLQGIIETASTALTGGSDSGAIAGGKALKPAATLFSQMASAISNFEASNNDFLSKNNKIS